MGVNGINYIEKVQVEQIGNNRTTFATQDVVQNSVFDGYIDNTNSYDGKIDASQQQEVGDCWLLSEAKTIQNTNSGAQAIKDAIDHNHTGSKIDPYRVTIYNSFGEKQTFEITSAEMDKYLGSNKNYSIGDGDTRLLEAAAAKYFIEEIDAGRMTGRSKDDPLEGSPYGVYSASYMLTGKVPHGLTTADIKPENKQYYDALTKDGIDKVFNQYANNPSDTAITVAFKERSAMQKLFGTVPEAQQMPNHAYAITGVNRDDNGNIVSVKYTNPWNSSVEYTVPYDKFCKIVTQIDYM